jgi:hypothetical protein
MIWFYWISGLLLALVWFVVVFQSALHFSEITDITRPEWQSPEGTVLPSLTVVVPARNEEADVGEALRSLVRRNHPDYTIIAVNDRSTDRTGEIMEQVATEAPAGRLRVLHVRELPPRWLGKTHAMWLAAQQATSDWILFTDGDCFFHPDSVGRALHCATRNTLDHLVLFPTTQVPSEQMMIALPAVMSNFALHRHWKIRDPKSRDHMGVGAFNLVRREAYVAIGGYEKLRLEVADDLKLGAAIKKAGLRQDVVFGHNMVRLRWAGGAVAVVRNLEKNLFAVLQFRLSLVLAVCIVVLFLAVWPFLGLVLAPGWAKCSFAFAVAMIAAAYFGVSRNLRVSPLLFLTCPISALLFIFATLRSAFAALRDGAITWRGTKYSLEELRKGS